MFLSRVPPFGYLRLIGYLLLTAAFRSLSRPSSAPGAKASSLRSSSLDHTSSSATNWTRILRILEVLRFTNCFLFEVILLSFQKIRLSTFFFDKIDSRTEHFLDLNSILISTHFLSLISRLSSVKDLSFTDLRLICNFQSTNLGFFENPTV